MKKYITIVVIVVVIIAAFFAGKNFDNIANNEENKAESLVGVYEAEDWNGKLGTLVLYEDGTSQYPSGGSSTWEMRENTVIFTVKSLAYDNGKRAMTIYFDNDLSDEEAKAISQKVSSFNNVEYINFLADEYQRRLYVRLVNEDVNDELYGNISTVDGVSSVEYEYLEVEEDTEHEAKIMENGLVLHGKFFVKVSG